MSMWAASATISRRLAQVQQRLNYPLVIAGGSLLDAAPGPHPLAQGTLMIAPVRPSDLSTAKPAIDALHQADKLADSYAIIGYASVEIADEAIKRADEQKQPIINLLRSGSFETALGTIKFDGKRHQDGQSQPFAALRFANGSS